MQPGATAWQGFGRVRNHNSVTRDNPNEFGSIGAFPAANTGSYGNHLISDCFAALATGPSDAQANLQLSSETLRLVSFIRRSLMSTQRQRATGTVEERLRKRSGASCEADGAFHSLTGGAVSGATVPAAQRVRMAAPPLPRHRCCATQKQHGSRSGLSCCSKGAIRRQKTAFCWQLRALLPSRWSRACITTEKFATRRRSGIPTRRVGKFSVVARATTTSGGWSNSHEPNPQCAQVLACCSSERRNFRPGLGNGAFARPLGPSVAPSRARRPRASRCRHRSPAADDSSES